jgi:prepilin-type N-terminal cleavage/methylation domain-containing protein
VTGRGFTLLEALVALAVLGMVMSGAFGVFSSGLRGLSRGDERLTVALFAESLLNRADLDLTLGAGEASGRTADGMSWRVTRQAFDLAAVNDGLTVVEPPPSSRAPDRNLLGPDAQAGQQQAGAGARSTFGSNFRFGPSDGSDQNAGADQNAAGDQNGAAQPTRAPASPIKMRAWRLTAAVQSARGETATLSRLSLERTR